MKVVIDLDLHAAIQDFTIRSSAGAYQFKSQDTVEWELYFVKNGFVQDMGSSFALKFGMIKTGDTAIPPTLLAYQTAFTYSTDSDGNVYYAGLVNFNTAQMATAIGTSPQINGTAEIRYQDTLNEIIHSINISTVVYATILVETGVTPPGVSTGYPDASTIELLVHKDAPSGYAGLNGSSQLFGAQIPVDNVTIQILDGQIASSAILAETAASFVTPAANATVSTTLVSSTGLVVGQYVRLPIAGYYIVESIPDSTHAVLQNNGDPFNVASGVTVPIDTPLLPAQAAAGGGGTPGQNAYTLTTASFTVPAVGAVVSVTMSSTAWLGGSGYYVFITGAGYYAVNSITDGTHAVLTNTGSASNAPPGTVVPTNSQVAASGALGATGASGAGLAAYDALAASFTMPAVSGTVTITISNTAWISVNQIIYIATAGYLKVSAISSATQVLVINLNYPGNATAGATIASGSTVSPGGLQGPQGAGGPGLNAFTTLSANFTQPAVNATVTINVGSTTWMAAGQQIFIQGGGYYTIASISDLTHAVVTNLGGPSNPGAGNTITGSGTQNVTPAGTPGTGGNAYTTITASYTQPAVGSSVTVSMFSTAWMVQNQYVFITGGGTYQVVNINDATHVVLQNVGATGNVVSGTVVPSGNGVTPSGSPGVQGPAGSGGGGGTLTDAVTTPGSSIIANPSGILKRIAAGSSNLTVSDSGSVLTLDAPGAGGGGGLLSRLIGVELFDDFTGYFSAVVGDSNPTLGWLLSQDSGSGAGIGIQTVSASGAPECGVWTLNCQTTGTTSLASLRMGPAATQAWGIGAPNAGALTIEWRVKQGGGLNTSANYAEWRLGILGNNSTSATWVGAFFLYNVVTSPNWQCYAYNGSTLSSADSGVAVSATAYQRLTFTLNSTWTTATFSIGGTTVATITGVSWAAATPWTPIASVGLRAGAGGWSQYMDWFYLKYLTSRP